MVNKILIKLISSFGKKLSHSQIGELHEKYSPEGVGIQLWEQSDNDYDHSTKVINLCESDLYEEVILHEIGHAVLSSEVGTSNYKLDQLWNKGKQGTKIPSKLFKEAEMEAWDWAEKHASKPWGIRSNLIKKLSLKSYNSMPEFLLLGNTNS